VIEVKTSEECRISKYQPTHIALFGDQVVQVVPEEDIKDINTIK
jgi:hypothetical protein